MMAITSFAALPISKNDFEFCKFKIAMKTMNILLAHLQIEIKKLMESKTLRNCEPVGISVIATADIARYCCPTLRRDLYRQPSRQTKATEIIIAQIDFRKAVSTTPVSRATPRPSPTLCGRGVFLAHNPRAIPSPSVIALPGRRARLLMRQPRAP